MNHNIKGNGNPMVDECGGTSIYTISNSMVANTSDNVTLDVLVEVSQNERNSNLVVFGHGISIPNVYSTAAIDLPNGVIISNLNDKSLIQICANSQVSTAHHHEFLLFIWYL